MGFKLPLPRINIRYKEGNKYNCIELFQGSLIRKGEFCTYGEDKQVGFIMDSLDKCYISKEERRACGISGSIKKDARYVLVREIITRHGVANPDEDRYDMLPPGLPEAIPTAVCNWIPVEEVHGIAFLFDIEKIQDLTYNPAGIANAYFTRRYTNPSGKYCTQKDFVSFHLGRSFSKRMWDFGCSGIKVSVKNMSGKEQWTGRRKITKLKGHNIEVLDFFGGRMVEGDDEGDVIERTYTTTKYHREQLHDLSIVNKKKRSVNHMVRCLNEPALKRARKSFGSNLGVANPAPARSVKKIRQGEDPLTELNTDALVRLVTLDKNHKDAQADKEVPPYEVVSSSVLTGTDHDEKEKKRIAREKYAVNCKHPNLTFTFTEHGVGDTEVTFDMRFKRVLGDSDVIKKHVGYRTRSRAAIERAAARRKAATARLANGTSVAVVTDDEGMANNTQHASTDSEANGNNTQTDEAIVNITQSETTDDEVPSDAGIANAASADSEMSAPVSIGNGLMYQGDYFEIVSFGEDQLTVTIVRVVGDQTPVQIGIHLAAQLVAACD